MEKRAVVSWESTAAEELPVYCRRCRRVIVFDIQPAKYPDRVTLRHIRPGLRRSLGRALEALTLP